MRRWRYEVAHRCIFVQQQMFAKFHPDRLKFGSTGAKTMFLSENKGRPAINRTDYLCICVSEHNELIL